MDLPRLVSCGLNAAGLLELGVTVICGGGSFTVEAREEARAGSRRRLPRSDGDGANPALKGVTGREDELPFAPLRPGTDRLFFPCSRALESRRLFPFGLVSVCGGAVADVVMADVPLPKSVNLLFAIPSVLPPSLFVAASPGLVDLTGWTPQSSRSGRLPSSVSPAQSMADGVYGLGVVG